MNTTNTTDAFDSLDFLALLDAAQADKTPLSDYYTKGGEFSGETEAQAARKYGFAPVLGDCPRCGGTGNIPHYAHVNDGVCFACGGTGNKDYSRAAER